MGWQGTVAPHLPSREGRWPSKGTAQMKQHHFYLLNSPSHFSTHYFCPILTPSLPSNMSGATRKLQDFWVCCQVWAVPPKRTVLPLDLSLAPMSLSHKSPLSPSATPLGRARTCAPCSGSAVLTTGQSGKSPVTQVSELQWLMLESGGNPQILLPERKGKKESAA